GAVQVEPKGGGPDPGEANSDAREEAALGPGGTAAMNQDRCADDLPVRGHEGTPEIQAVQAPELNGCVGAGDRVGWFARHVALPRVSGDPILTSARYHSPRVPGAQASSRPTGPRKGQDAAGRRQSIQDQTGGNCRRDDRL